MKRRIVSLLLIVTIIYTVMPIASAEEDVLVGEVLPFDQECICPVNDSADDEERASVAEMPEPRLMMAGFYEPEPMDFEQLIVERCMEYGTPDYYEYIDLSEYCIPEDEFEELYNGVMMRHPELLMGVRYSWIVDEGMVWYFVPVFLVSEEEAAAARAQVLDGIEHYVDLAQEYTDPVDQLLNVHDQMIADCQYDTSSPRSRESYTTYGFLKNHYAVCQGYAQTFYAVATRLGFEVDFCRSKEIDHIWNWVKLQNDWYHIDLTWDDPLYEDGSIHTEAHHNNFLIDDTKRAEIVQMYFNTATASDWMNYDGVRIPCTNTQFEQGYFFNFAAPFTAQKNEVGEYEMVLTSSAGKPITFSTPILNFGSIMTSKEATKTGRFGMITIYYYCAEALGNEISLVHKVSNGTEQSGLTIQNIGKKVGNNIYSLTMNAAAVGKTDEIYFWDAKTMKPYSVKRAYQVQ